MPSGAITIDDGAATALVERGTSLLPVGVTACSGGFQVGDVVEVITGDGLVVGKGVAAMSESQVTAVAGMSSAAAREAQPGFPGEVIHRDQFVLIG
jgi:glutamate 5-kinase